MPEFLLSMKTFETKIWRKSETTLYSIYIIFSPFYIILISIIDIFKILHPYIQHENMSLEIKFGAIFILFTMWIRDLDDPIDLSRFQLNSHHF